MADANLNGAPCEVCKDEEIHVVGSPYCLNRMGIDALDADTLVAALRLLSAERARADRAEETLRLTRDGADLLVGAEEARQALEEKLREACGGSEPSEGHDYADEVIGLLRVTRGQREAAERDAASLRERVGELASKFADPGTALDTQEKYLAREVLRLLSAPSSSPAATGSDAMVEPCLCSRAAGTRRPGLAHHTPDHCGALACVSGDRTSPACGVCWAPLPAPASPSPGESDATTNSSNEEG